MMDVLMTWGLLPGGIGDDDHDDYDHDNGNHDQHDDEEVDKDEGYDRCHNEDVEVDSLSWPGGDVISDDIGPDGTFDSCALLTIVRLVPSRPTFVIAKLIAGNSTIRRGLIRIGHRHHCHHILTSSTFHNYICVTLSDSLLSIRVHGICHNCPQ